MAYKSPNIPPPPVRIPVICVNDTGRPAEVPISKWVRKGERYTIVGFSRMIAYNCMGVWLEEIDISTYHPYKVFRAERFVEEDALKSLDERLEQLLEEARTEYAELEPETV